MTDYTQVRRVPYDYLVLATGSAPFVPNIAGVEKDGVFVYRTIEDLEMMQSYATKARKGAVIGGGLLGGEAAKALLDLGLADASIFAIGECALHEGMIYGLVAPGYDMANVLAENLVKDTHALSADAGKGARFKSFDMSTKLKLIGVDVASFGDAFAEGRT
ncbi:MAG: FAD-dependent oxidoreductase, partial [Spirosomaceae bacterium]|nr:FAD-dependent oxidoreductase [Spirosomataceae bacterium]